MKKRTLHTIKARFIAASVIVIMVLAILPVIPAYAAACNSGVSGNWSAITWSCGHTPGAADTVTILNGNTVTITSSDNVSVTSVTINTGGVLINNGTLTAPTTTVNGTGILTNNAAMTVATTLTGTGMLTQAPRAR